MLNGHRRGSLQILPVTTSYKRQALQKIKSRSVPRSIALGDPGPSWSKNATARVATKSPFAPCQNVSDLTHCQGLTNSPRCPWYSLYHPQFSTHAPRSTDCPSQSQNAIRSPTLSRCVWTWHSSKRKLKSLLSRPVLKLIPCGASSAIWWTLARSDFDTWPDHYSVVVVAHKCTHARGAPDTLWACFQQWDTWHVPLGLLLSMVGYLSSARRRSFVAIVE
jgi:hypothetical protein